MNLKTTLMISTTAIERSMGRFMKAPDHDASSGTPPPADGQSSGAKAEDLSVEEALEREFDNHEDESGTAASPEDDDGDDDSDEDEDEDDDEPEADGDGDEGEDGSDEDSEGDQKPKKNRARERIDELTNEVRFKEREAQRLRDEVTRLGGDPNAVGSTIEVPEAPDASKYQYGEQDVDYIRDHAKYEAKMEVLENQAKATFKAQAAELDAKWTKNQVEAHKKYPDFDEVVVKGGSENKWPCPPVIAVAIKDSDVGADVAYHLASNPEEAKRIATLTPLEQAREFGRIEERLTIKAARAAKREKQPVRISKAPPPPKRRTQGSGASKNPKFDTDFTAFEKQVDANKMIR